MATGGSLTGGVSTGGKATGGTGTGGGATGGTSCTTPPSPSPLIGWASVSGSGVTTTTGGGTATPTVVTSLSALSSAASGTTAAVIYVQGNFTGSVSIGSNKTIVGICGATITGHIGISGSSNVIVRNLKIVGNNCTDSPSDCSAGADAVGIGNSAHHVWFDHCDISDGSDGNLDINNASDFVTISWTKFSYSSARTDPVAGASGHRFSNLVGSADNLTADEGKLNVTYHHIWWANNVDQRMPRVRYGKIHVFNSLYTTTGNNYCIGVGMASSVRDENNVFIGSTRPVNTTSFIDSRSTVNSIGNVYTNISGGNPVDIGTAFTPPYAYSLDAASTVQNAVQTGAGPH
jgi:pectate lyase